MVKRNLILYASIFSFMLGINSGFCCAEETSLGLFSAAAAQGKFSKNLTLKVKDASLVLKESDIQKLIAQKEELFYNPKHQSEIENINFCQYKKLLICELLFPTVQKIISKK
ncbi:MAG: hypothetical protein NTZ97_00990 [Candidatus Moranbacteria bacterium]|nr:hypothetical protein [Candidatus Moranbacteria bacterium]